MHGLLLGVITPDNTPHGANLTFLLPEIGFIVIAAWLFLRFRRPHRVPGHGKLVLARSSQPGPAASRPGSAPPGEQAALATPATDQAAAGQPEQAAAGDPEDGP